VKGAAGWMFTTWLGLIALQTLTTKGASGRVASAFTDLNSVLDRILDPTIPAIPDRRPGAATTTAAAAPAPVPFSTPVPYAVGVTPRFPALYNVTTQ
jgi:hypothetical protein